MASTTQAARRSSELPGPGTRSKPHAEDTVQPWSGVVTARRDEKTSEPGVYRRGGRYVLIYRDRQGRQHRKAAGRTLAEAKIAKAKILAAVATGDVRGGKTRVTFAQYVDGWVETYKGRNNGGIRPATKREYERALKLRVVPFFGRMRLVDVGPLDVKKFLSETAASGVSYDTTRLALAALRVVFATAVEDEIVRVNPCAGIRVPRAERVDEDDEAGPKALTPDQLRALLDAAPADWRLLFELLAHTGLRISEALALEWRDIDLGQRQLRVRRAPLRRPYRPTEEQVRATSHPAERGRLAGALAASRRRRRPRRRVPRRVGGRLPLAEHRVQRAQARRAGRRRAVGWAAHPPAYLRDAPVPRGRERRPGPGVARPSLPRVHARHLRPRPGG
jgi:integrase